MARQNLFPSALKKFISTGLKIYAIGAYPVSFGGVTAYLPGTARIAAK